MVAAGLSPGNNIKKEVSSKNDDVFVHQNLKYSHLTPDNTISI